jgi:hypothetical protein
MHQLGELDLEFLLVWCAQLVRLPRRPGFEAGRLNVALKHLERCVLLFNFCAVE